MCVNHDIKTENEKVRMHDTITQTNHCSCTIVNNKICFVLVEYTMIIQPHATKMVKGLKRYTYDIMTSP